MQDEVTYSGRFWLRFADDDEMRLEILDQMKAPERGLRPHVWRPPTDVWESEDSYQVRVELAGMRGSEISLTLHRASLIIQGNRPEATVSGAYQQMEIAYGEFSTEVNLQHPVDAESVRASYEDGFLSVTLPKAKPDRIPIRQIESGE